MNASKQQYLDSIRANTAYPTYRSVIGIIALLGYLSAGLVGLAALVTGFGGMRASFFMGFLTLVGGLICAALIYFMTKFWKEAALILVDLGDSTVDTNSRTPAAP